MPSKHVKMPIEPAAREVMNSLAGFINDLLPAGYGFALLVFRFDDSGFMNWISNADRDDMKKALREFLEHLEAEGN